MILNKVISNFISRFCISSWRQKRLRTAYCAYCQRHHQPDFKQHTYCRKFLFATFFLLFLSDSFGNNSCYCRGIIIQETIVFKNESLYLFNNNKFLFLFHRQWNIKNFILDWRNYDEKNSCTRIVIDYHCLF